MSPTNSTPSPGGGNRIGRFVLERELGRGGMAAVFLARDEKNDRQVALKVMNHVAESSDDAVVRFRREANFMLALQHNHIVTAYEVGIEEGRHYLAMEYVEGESLRERVMNRGPLPYRDALVVMRQIASALEYISINGIVHRDVKPQNILFVDDKTAKLSDVGLAILAHRKDLRLTAPGLVIGTPTYMSPEQARADSKIDWRSDIYSLGCSIYYAICSRPPITGSNGIEIAQRHLTDAPVPPSKWMPDVPAQVDELLMRCLAKSPDHRYMIFGDLIKAIDACMEKTTTAKRESKETTRSSSTQFEFVKRATPIPGRRPSSSQMPVAVPAKPKSSSRNAAAPSGSGSRFPGAQHLPPMPTTQKASGDSSNTRLKIAQRDAVPEKKSSFSVERIVTGVIAAVAALLVMWMLFFRG